MSDATPRLSSLTQERSRNTYQSLLDAADDLWAKRDFDDTTVSEICAAAGVAKGTFYFYFPRKESLLFALTLSGLDPIAEEIVAVLAAGEQSTEQVLHDAMDAVGRLARSRPKHLVRRVSEETLHAIGRFDQIRGDHPTYGDLVQPIFSAAIERQDLPQTFTALELSSLLGWAMVQAVHGWSADLLGGMALERFLHRRVALIWHGAKAGEVG